MEETSWVYTRIREVVTYEVEMIKLNIGGGKNHPKHRGWKIVDLRPSADIICDISQENIPLPSYSVEKIICSHTLEHIYREQLLFVLKEFYRLLTIDGIVRITVPDIRLAINAYLASNRDFFLQSEVSQTEPDAPIGELLASWFYSTRRFKDPALKYGDGHVHCFDIESMYFWLHKAGFTRIHVSTYQQSLDEELQQDGFDLHPHDSLYIEARP